jgi:hypothetical protein
MAGRQLNIRLESPALDELEGHAFLRRVTAGTVARDVILKFLREARDEPGLDDAMKARREHDRAQRQDEIVTPLRSPPSRKPR